MSKEEERHDGNVHVFDRRAGESSGRCLPLWASDNLPNLGLKTRIFEAFGISESSNAVLTTTDREEINDDVSLVELVEPGDTLYILNKADQELSAPVEEKVNYPPHYDTLLKSGLYEYYASEGQNPLPFALAELIDNSLAATANNAGSRTIEIKLLFNESAGRNSVCIFDNGRGMTSRDLNNWAIYRLSKFRRRARKGQNPHDTSILEKESMPRSLNSDISYFGVGGKQAIFFIGDCTRMITKSSASKDVHEICLSKEDFERKEVTGESVFSGFIRNRRPGDASYIDKDDEHYETLVEKETKHDSFTIVWITGIHAEHIKYLKSHFKMVCRQLSHIYHYYLHGPNGNIDIEGPSESSGHFREIDISVALQDKGKKLKCINLRDIKNDIHTQFVRSSVSSFEFTIFVEGCGTVEGVIRYHPFKYDRETYPLLQDSDTDSEHDDDHRDVRYPRGNRPMFECYWNGRLIPYTTIDSLDFCLPPKRPVVPARCFYRTSGVLFTNDGFQVSTNKLTFTDLEVKLKQNTAVYKVLNFGQEQTVRIATGYREWIRVCHQYFDKQIKFIGNMGQQQQAGNKQLWTCFRSAEWGGRTFSPGTLVKIGGSRSFTIGGITKFLLKGSYEEDELFGHAGSVELIKEPSSIWKETNVFRLSFIDSSVSEENIRSFIADEELSLPSQLQVEWPMGDGIEEGDTIATGSTIGVMKVTILNGKEEPVNNVAGDKGRTLLVELTLTWHSEKGGDKVLSKCTCQHMGRSWPYWFRKIENVTGLGRYSLKLRVVLSDAAAYLSPNFLPETTINFSVTVGSADYFIVNNPSLCVQIGIPFKISLTLMDSSDNVLKPNVDDYEPTLSVTWLDVSYSRLTAKRYSLILKDVIVKGNLDSAEGKDHLLKVTLPYLSGKTETITLKVVPGLPANLIVTPMDDEIEVENGSALAFKVVVNDNYGNIPIMPQLDVVCKFTGFPNLPVYTADCSLNGQGILTGDEIDIKGLKKMQKLTAEIELQDNSAVPAVQRTVLVIPSSRPAQFEVFYQPAGSDLKEKLVNEQMVQCVVGEVITGLAFRILDEGNRLMNIDSTLASKIKVNWAAKIPREMIKLGSLPDVKAPTYTQETKYCQISLVFRGSSIEFSFLLHPRAGTPDSIKCSCARPWFRVCHRHEEDIIVNILDSYGNQLELEAGDLEDLQVSCPGLDEKETKIVLRKSEGFVIRDVTFVDKKLGKKELSIRWKRLECIQKLELLSGPAEGLKLVDFDCETPISVISGQTFPEPIKIQVVDIDGYPAKEANTRVALHYGTCLKLLPPPPQQKVNEDKCVEFLGFTINGKRGTYPLTPKAIVGRKKTIEGPAINICIEPDRTKPMAVKGKFCTGHEVMVVGQTLPAISACVLAEDDNPMAGVNHKEITLKVWYTGDGTPKYVPSSKALTFHPSRESREDDEPGVLYFRDVTGLERAGSYSFVVLYRKAGSVHMMSKHVCFEMVARDPVKLVPVGYSNVPAVSNSKKISSRTIISDLPLQLQDEYGNRAGADLNGVVVVQIISEGITEAPAFELGHDYMSLQLRHGEVKADSLRLQANCAGVDGQEYLLKFTVNLGPAVAIKIEPYCMPFLFYDDMKKQEEMALLSKERDKLVNDLLTYRALVNATNHLLAELRDGLRELTEQETQTLDELRKNHFFDIQGLTTPENIDTAIFKLEEKRRNIEKLPRRQCNMPRGPTGQGIVGKVAHLAQIEDDAAAYVLSWHMSSDMDCVVTTTTEQANRIYRDTGGKQQVLPLDSAFKKSLPDWRKPLPHDRCRGFRPTGNPVYARNLLYFPDYDDECRTVFGMLLGDTIVVDALDDATAYREEVVKCCFCPTILAKTGERVRSNGKFGGLQNRAPPIERLHGFIFTAPIPNEYKQASLQIDLLSELKQILTRKKNAKSELDHQCTIGQSEDMKKQHREYVETEAKLKEIESRLGLTQLTNVAPRSPGCPSRTARDGQAKRSPQTSQLVPAVPSPTKSLQGKRVHEAAKTVTVLPDTAHAKSMRSKKLSPDAKKRKPR